MGERPYCGCWLGEGLRRPLKCDGFHCESCGFGESEEEVHGVDSVSGGSLEEVVDYGCYEEPSVDLIEVDYALVCVDHVLQVGNLGCDECEVVVVEVVLVDFDDLGEFERAVEIGDGHNAPGERASHRHHVEA